MTEKLGIGEVITGEQQRDAIHVAVMPIVVGDHLWPGNRVIIRDGKAYFAEASAIGVIDPFLKQPVYPGTTVWLFLNPGSITSLRHDWTHPTIDSPTKVNFTKEESEAWLREYISSVDCPDFDTVIAAATEKYVEPVEAIYGPNAYRNDGEYLYFAGREAHAAIPPEFWYHIENYTGVVIPNEKKAEHFTCSC